MSLPLRPLGTTGLEVSAIGLGTWQLGNHADWGRMDDATALDLIAAALDRGVTLFDTAPNYASTHSERLLGEALRGRRHDAVIVSKFGHLTNDRYSFTVDDFWKSLHASLRRLRTDVLDVLLLHNPPLALLESADPLWSALARAREEGKIRHYGASIDTAREIEVCLAHTDCEVLEILFNVLHQDARRAFDAVRAHGTGTICKVPLDSGWLSGRYDASSRFEGIRARWTPEQIEERSRLVDGIRWLADARPGLASGALAFTLAYDVVSCVIPGIRSRAQLDSAVASVGVPLRDAERARLETYWEEFTEHGARTLPW